MNQILRRYAPYGAAVLVAAGVVTVGLLQGPTTPLARPLLISLQPQTSSAYLARQAQPPMAAPSGTTSSLHCPFNDLSGSLQCTNQAGTYYELAKNGAPVYQLRTPIPVLGQGRKGWNFAAGSSERVCASDNATHSMGESSFTVEAVVTPRNISASSEVFVGGPLDTHNDNTGWSFYTTGSGRVVINILKQLVNFYCQTAVGTLESNKTYRVTATATYAAGAWSSFTTYVNGQSVACTTGGAGVAGAIDNSFPVCVGASHNTAGYNHHFTGEIHELIIRRGVVDDAATVLARYRAQLATGAYTSTDGSTQGLYRFSETAATSLVDYSGGNNHLTAVNGTPDVQYGAPPYPMGSGLTKRSIYSADGATSFFLAGDTAAGDLATSNFSITLLVKPDNNNTNGEVWISKRKEATLKGFELGRDTAANGRQIKFLLGDGSGFTSGWVSGVGPLNPGTWNCITVNATRASTATAIINRVPTGVTLNISARQLSISSDRGLYVFRSGEAGLPASTTSIAGFLVADKVMTVDEHTNACAKWMKPPETVASFTRNSSACHGHGNEPGFGERIGCYGPGQWPMGYKAASVSNPRGNPAGWAFPHRSATTNVLGYANEFDQWSWGGAAPTHTPNSVEGPDGSMTADLVSLPNTGYIYKAVVGGGNVAAGERWGFSAWAKKFSGACTHICLQPAGGGELGTCFVAPSQWTRLSAVAATAGNLKTGYIYGNGMSQCVIGLATAQYEANNVTDPCTTTPGNVTQTCNAPLVTGSFENKSNLLKWSEVFDTSSWSKSFASIGSAAVILPDGSTGYANILHEDGTAGTTHFIDQLSTAIPGKGYCISWQAKPLNRSWVAIGQRAGTDNSTCYADIQNGVFGVLGTGCPAGSVISSAGNGWYRVAVPWTSTITTAPRYALWAAAGDGLAGFNGLNQDSVYISGASVSPGACPGSYNKTTTEVLAGNNLMPSSLYRGEVEVQATMVPYVSTPGYRRVLVASGDDRVLLTEGQIPTFVWSGQGGSMEAVARGKPITYQDVSRKYTISWNNEPSEGLTNTNPRRYAALSIDGAYQRTTLSPRTRDAVDVQSQRDLGSTTFYIGGDASGNSCNCDIESWELYGRPAQVARSTQADHIVTLDLTGAGYLQNAQSPSLCDSTFGVEQAKRWCVQGNAWSGSLYDVWNGVEWALAGTTVQFQSRSGLIGRGHGRRTIYLDAANYVTAASPALHSVGARTGYTVAMIARVPTPVSAATLFTSMNMSTPAGGYYVHKDSTGKFIGGYYYDGATYRQRASTASFADNNYHMVHLVLLDNGGHHDANLYVDGVLNHGTSGGAVFDGAIVNSQPLQLGRNPVGAAFGLNGDVAEFYTKAASMNAAEVLADYKRAIQGGWIPTGTFEGLYALDEFAVTNGTGLKDLSGNGNSLSVVTGAPSPSYRDAPWPLGSGMTRTHVTYGNAAGDYHSASSTAVATPGAAPNPFSFAVMFRNCGSTANPVVVRKVAAADNQYFLYHDGAAGWVCYLKTSAGGTSTSAGVGPTAANDCRWHVVSCKYTFHDGGWYPQGAIDGGVFGATTSATTAGDPSLNNAALQLGPKAATAQMDIEAFAFWKDYALTDANVAAFQPNGKDPTGGLLTYARTSTSAKGICYDSYNDPVLGMGVTCFADNAVPYHWRSEHTTLPGNEHMGLGLPRHEAFTNSTQNSEAVDAATWTRTFVTASPNTVVAPDGTLTADTLAETVDANVHVWNANQVTVLAQNATFTTSVYLKKATNTNWINVRGYENGGSYIYANVRLDTFTIGNSGANGADVTSQASNIYGAANGWIRVVLKGTCVKVGGCSVRTYAAFTNNTDPAAGALVNYAGAIANAVYVWGQQTGAPAASADIYCPTPGAASATCNAPTSMYVAAANMASWTRAVGVIDWVGYTGSTTGWAYVGNGIAQSATASVNTYIYNDLSVEQQRLIHSNAQANVLTGSLLVYDSTGAFYGTRRALGTTFQANYAGGTDTWGIDTGANWTPAAASNLYLGADSFAASPINGDTCFMSIHSAR